MTIRRRFARAALAAMSTVALASGASGAEAAGSPFTYYYSPPDSGGDGSLYYVTSSISSWKANTQGVAAGNVGMQRDNRNWRIMRLSGCSYLPDALVILKVIPNRGRGGSEAPIYYNTRRCGPSGSENTVIGAPNGIGYKVKRYYLVTKYRNTYYASRAGAPPYEAQH